ncbi:nitric-oxide synthase [Paenibacillus anaericanus]|uniref:nitric oxide synthase oxygenase n=1 Tax=Paenibacillus anaericanus TaxID=170367 RepID=UPI00278B7A68|nr:nitric oxide synthase oxygenase [Paenibacillus anaericanus]MDQ0091520.1 nitric-oxide synthase [Paenibacillus anaericanus]
MDREIHHNENQLQQEAELFIRSCYHELGQTADDTEFRVQQVSDEINRNGSYTHTYEELVHGAKMAWRNSNRCIGRLFWNRLHVFDARDLDGEEMIFQALLRHIEFATNGGEIRPTITIFKQASLGGEPISIWNHQLLRYAGYEMPGGNVIGDPSSVRFTKVCESLGWKGEGTSFDLLPLVIQCSSREPRVFDLPKEIVLEVPICHPELDLFRGEEVKWYAVPIISDMRLEIGGTSYVAAPFNGWYMGTEIGARNLADEFRYNLLPRVAIAMGLDTTTNVSLWKDRALVELNVAVLHSFRECGVSIVDHHTAAQQFGAFQKNEKKEARDVTGRWSWLIPPLSPATTDIFHSTFDDRLVTPNFFHQENPYLLGE